VPAVDRRSRGLAAVVIQGTAQPLTTYDPAAVGCVIVRWCDEPVAETLVVSFSVIVRDILENNLPEVALAQRDDACETLSPY
jgi:hypothetical protein